MTRLQISYNIRKSPIRLNGKNILPYSSLTYQPPDHRVPAERLKVIKSRPWSALIPNKDVPSREELHEQHKVVGKHFGQPARSIWPARADKRRPVTVQEVSQHRQTARLLKRFSLLSARTSGAETAMDAAFAHEITRLLVLRDSPASMVHLDISSNNRIRDAGIISLCPVIQHLECTLVTLNFSSVNLGPSVAIALFRYSFCTDFASTKVQILTQKLQGALHEFLRPHAPHWRQHGRQEYDSCQVNAAAAARPRTLVA
jgi:hypothetical protein